MGMEGKSERRKRWGSIREKEPGVFELRFLTIDSGGGKHRASRTLVGSEQDAEAFLAARKAEFEAARVRMGLDPDARIRKLQEEQEKREQELAEEEARKRSRRRVDGRFAPMMIGGGEQEPNPKSVRTAPSMSPSPRRDLWAHGSEPWTVDEVWLQSYWPQAVGSDLAATTLKGYKQVFNAEISPAFGDLEMGSITHAEVQRFLDTLPHGTAKHAVSVLRLLFNHAQYERIITSSDNIMRDRYKMPTTRTRKTVRELHICTSEELDQILAESRQQPFWAAVAFMGKAGLRVAEACGLRWEDMTFVERDGELWCRASVERNAVMVDHQLIIKKPKTQFSSRQAFVPEPWSAELRKESDRHGGEGWITDNGLGSPMTAQQLTPMWKRWALETGHPYTPLLHLRNAYATDLHRRGVDLARVGQLLGHSRASNMAYEHYDVPQEETLLETLSAAQNATIEQDRSSRNGDSMPPATQLSGSDELEALAHRIAEVLIARQGS